VTDTLAMDPADAALARRFLDTPSQRRLAVSSRTDKRTAMGGRRYRA
jgi:hypothetical protein